MVCFTIIINTFKFHTIHKIIRFGKNKPTEILRIIPQYLI